MIMNNLKTSYAKSTHFFKTCHLLTRIVKATGMAFGVALLLSFVLPTSAFSQEIKNIRVTQEGTRVNLQYDLDGKNQSFKVNLYYRINDGLTWQGPLKGATGDVGDKVQPGNNKKIIWDLLSEAEIKEGYLQFKVVADVTEVPVTTNQATLDPKSNIKMRKYKTGKTISLVTAIASAGTGIFATIQGNKLYDEYKTATDDAASLHSQIETYDKIAPVAFAIAGASTVSFIIFASKHRKSKKQLSFQPFPLRDGGGLAISYTF